MIYYNVLDLPGGYDLEDHPRDQWLVTRKAIWEGENCNSRSWGINDHHESWPLTKSHRIHRKWYIYLHLVDFDGKFRWIYQSHGSYGNGMINSLFTIHLPWKLPGTLVQEAPVKAACQSLARWKPKGFFLANVFVLKEADLTWVWLILQFHHGFPTFTKIYMWNKWHILNRFQ